MLFKHAHCALNQQYRRTLIWCQMGLQAVIDCRMPGACAAVSNVRRTDAGQGCCACCAELSAWACELGRQQAKLGHSPPPTPLSVACSWPYFWALGVGSLFLLYNICEPGVPAAKLIIISLSLQALFVFLSGSLAFITSIFKIACPAAQFAACTWVIC